MNPKLLARLEHCPEHTERPRKVLRQVGLLLFSQSIRGYSYYIHEP